MKKMQKEMKKYEKNGWNYGTGWSNETGEPLFQKVRDTGEERIIISPDCSTYKIQEYEGYIYAICKIGEQYGLYKANDSGDNFHLIMDGATGFQKFIYVTIPGIKQNINFCIVTTLITALQVFDQVYVMTKGGPLYKTETLVSYIYNQGFQVAPYDLGYASSIAVYLFLMVAIITFVLRRFVLNRGTEE